MNVDAARAAFESDGFAVLPAFLSGPTLEAARSELTVEFPSADEFHDEVDPARAERFRDEFGGITDFPFTSTALSLVAVDEQLIDLAASLLGADDLRVYSIEAWAKYTGAADYDQPHHRDYLNHTLLAPSRAAAAQVEMFLYLGDVPVELGPPAYVSREVTGATPALPNWYPRADGATDDRDPSWVSPHGRPDWYAEEVVAAGPAGTVVVYRLDTFHRGTALRVPRGARYTIHVNFRRADADWIGRRVWTDAANSDEWRRFVAAASVRQLQLFGFPPPAHPYWTEETLAGVALRYPGFDPRPWAG